MTALSSIPTGFRSRIAQWKSTKEKGRASENKTFDAILQFDVLYAYYRCVYYNKDDHPRVRLNESKFDSQILEIVFLNCVLDDVTLVPEWRKPFDALAEGLISKDSRGERIRTFDPLLPKQVRCQTALRPEIGGEHDQRFGRDSPRLLSWLCYPIFRPIGNRTNAAA